MSLCSLFGFRSLQQQVINQNLILQIPDFLLCFIIELVWVGDFARFVRQFAGHVQGPRGFRLGCVGDLADALFTGFACGGELAIGVEHILLAVERSHGAHHMRFDSVHTLPLVERLSLHEQVLNVNMLCLVTID